MDLQADKDSLEGRVRERDNEIQSLRATLKEVETTPTKTVTIETGVQATPPSRERAQVDAGVQATPPTQQGIDASIQTDRIKEAEVHSKEVELHSKGAELHGEKTDRENTTNGKSKEPVHPQPPANGTDQNDLSRVKKVNTPRTSLGVDHAHSLPLHAPQNSSLESEMRIAGVEVIDPYDSSEGVGFSDSNLDEVPDSMHSLDSFKSDKVKEELSTMAALDHEQRGVQIADSAVPVARLVVDQQLSSTVAEQQTVGRVAGMNLDLQEEESSSSSDGDLRPRNDQGTCICVYK